METLPTSLGAEPTTKLPTILTTQTLLNMLGKLHPNQRGKHA